MGIPSSENCLWMAAFNRFISCISPCTNTCMNDMLIIFICEILLLIGHYRYQQSIHYRILSPDGAAAMPWRIHSFARNQCEQRRRCIPPASCISWRHSVIPIPKETHLQSHGQFLSIQCSDLFRFSQNVLKFTAMMPSILTFLTFLGHTNKKSN